MKYFLAQYTTRDGDHEYTEQGVLMAHDAQEADKKAIKGKELFDRGDWAEFCEYSHINEIPKEDYDVLRKYTTDIDQYMEEEK